MIPRAQVAVPNQTAGMGDLNLPLAAPQIGFPVQQIAPQVQQPGPFVPTPAATVGNPGWPAQQVVPTAATTSPSDIASTGRRRRRTAAEMQAVNPASPAATPGTVASQAPFPHSSSPSGFAEQVPGQPAAPAQTDMGFGMSQGQPAAGNPELTAMLDDFFTKG